MSIRTHHIHDDLSICPSKSVQPAESAKEIVFCLCETIISYSFMSIQFISVYCVDMVWEEFGATSMLHAHDDPYESV